MSVHVNEHVTQKKKKKLCVLIFFGQQQGLWHKERIYTHKHNAWIEVACEEGWIIVASVLFMSSVDTE